MTVIWGGAMIHSLEEDYRDFMQIQGLKGHIDLPKAVAELGLNEEELYEFINERVIKLESQGLTPQNAGEYLGTVLLFGYWLRGVRGPQ